MSKIKLISCVAVVAAIFYLSNQPASQSGAASLVLTEQLNIIVEKIFPGTDWSTGSMHNLLRKTAHFFIFLLLGLLMMNLLDTVKKRVPYSAIWAFGICAAFALLDETHQLFIEGRSAEAGDVLIDSSGAAVGIGLYLAVKAIVRSRLFKREEKTERQLKE